MENITISFSDSKLLYRIKHGGGKKQMLAKACALEHLKNPSQALRRLAACVRPDGKILISVPNVAHLYVRFMLLVGQWNYTDRGILDRTHLHFFTRKTFRAFLEKSGLNVKRIKPIVIPWNELFHSAGLVSFFTKLNQILNRLLPTWFAYQWVAVAEKENSSV